MLRKYFSVLKNHKHFKLGLILTAVLFCVAGGVAFGLASKSEDNKTVATKKNASENAKSHEDGNVEGASTEASDGEQSNSTSSTDKKSSSDKKSSDPAKKEQPTGQTPSNQQQVAKSTKLLFDKQSVVFLPGSMFAHAEIYSESGEGFGYVSSSNYGPLLVTVTQSYRSPAFTNRQYIQIVRPSGGVVGETTVQFTAKDQKGNVYTGKLPVKWPLVPYFSVEQGAATRTVNGDTTTFTFDFKITPNSVFGTPVLRFNLQGVACSSGSVSSIVTTYNGNNNFSLTCIVPSDSTQASGGWTVGMKGSGELVLGGASFTYWAPSP
jgi:hypothetical protein